MDKTVYMPSRVIQEFTLQAIRDGIMLGAPFRFILLFDAREEAEEALATARVEIGRSASILYFRPICHTKDKKWRLYLTNLKLQTYSKLM